MQQYLETFLNQHQGQADAILVTHISDETQYYQARGGRADPCSIGTTQGYYLEIQTNGAKVYGSTPSMQQLPNLFQMLKTRANVLKPHQLVDFSHQTPPQTSGSYKSANASSTLSARAIQDVLCEYSHTLLNGGLFASEASCFQIHRESLSMHSSGAVIHQTMDASALHLSSTAEKAGETQTRTNGFRSLQVPLEYHFKDADEVCQRIRTQALELVHAENCPNATLDLVLAPDQLYLQVHESIGHPLELDRILGDERNYAGFSFINLSDIGSLAYGSPLLNVTFDSNAASEMASYSFDDTGLKAEPLYIIKDGKLLRALGGGDSQYRCEAPGIACARQTSWNRAPIDRMANINIEPGSSSFDDMIASIENGIYMETNRSWSIDDYRRKFQFGAEYARLIKDGKLGAVVKNPNYRGTTLPFWHSLSHVGNADTKVPWGTLWCGKGEPNQIIRVGHAVPVCAFRNVEVFGGAA